jgi:hypothetical protein
MMSSLGSDGAVFGLDPTSRHGDADPFLQALSGACPTQMGIAFGRFKTFRRTIRVGDKSPGSARFSPARRPERQMNTRFRRHSPAAG